MKINIKFFAGKLILIPCLMFSFVFCSNAFGGEKTSKGLVLGDGSGEPLGLKADVIDLGPIKKKGLNLSLPDDFKRGGTGANLPRPGDGYKLILVVNNDVFSKDNTDRHLTNQIRIGAITKRVPKVLRKYIEDDEYLLMTLSQEIYTPEDLKSVDVVEDERPYAGYLYFTLGKVSERDNRIDVTTIDLGIVGPSALADHTQKEFHNFTGGTTVRGWHNQLRDEIAFNIDHDSFVRVSSGGLFEKVDILESVGWELLKYYGLSLGTVNTSLRAGYSLRVGNRFPDDKGSGLRLKEADKSWKVYGSLRVQGELVFHNIFLDGNSEKDSHRVDKEEFIGEAAAGITLQKGPLGISFEQIVRSEEFEGQNGNDVSGGFQIVFDYLIK